MMNELEILIDSIGDQYFSMLPDDCQNEDFPNSVDIFDAEGDVLITISCEGNSIIPAQCLVKLLNTETNQGVKR